MNMIGPEEAFDYVNILRTEICNDCLLDPKEFTLSIESSWQPSGAYLPSRFRLWGSQGSGWSDDIYALTITKLIEKAKAKQAEVEKADAEIDQQIREAEELLRSLKRKKEIGA